MTSRTLLGFTVGVCALGLISGAAAAAPDPARDAEAVVHSFNAAFEKKDIENLVAHFADGGVQFDLRPAHADQAGPHNIAQELKERWYGVTPILFAATASYSRKAEIIETRATEDMATVWTKTTSNMLMPKAPKPSTTSFTEVYFLVHTPKGWKIGAMMDDRATDNLSTATPAPPK